VENRAKHTYLENCGNSTKKKLFSADSRASPKEFLYFYIDINQEICEGYSQNFLQSYLSSKRLKDMLLLLMRLNFTHHVAYDE